MATPATTYTADDTPALGNPVYIVTADGDRIVTADGDYIVVALADGQADRDRTPPTLHSADATETASYTED